MIDFNKIQTGDLVYFPKDVCIPDIRPGEFGVDQDITAGTLARVIGKTYISTELKGPRSITVLILTDTFLDARSKRKQYEKTDKHVDTQGSESDISDLDAALSGATDQEKSRRCVEFFQNSIVLCDPDDVENYRGQYKSWEHVEPVASDDDLKKLLSRK